MEIEKKVLPQYFQEIVDGKKNYELRLGDFDCKEGDILLLKEWNSDDQQYTGRELRKTVTYNTVFKIDDLFWSKEDIEKYGIQIISFHPDEKR